MFREKLDLDEKTSLEMLEWMWDNCKIVYYGTSYPTEHQPHAKKDCRDLIEAEFLDHKNNKT